MKFTEMWKAEREREEACTHVTKTEDKSFSQYFYSI